MRVYREFTNGFERDSANHSWTLETGRSRIGWPFPVLEECKRGQVPYCPINDLATEHSGPLWKHFLFEKQREQQQRRLWSLWASRGESAQSFAATTKRKERDFILKDIFDASSHWILYAFIVFVFVLEGNRERGFTAANQFPLPDLGITMKNVGDTFSITIQDSRYSSEDGKEESR